MILCDLTVLGGAIKLGVDRDAHRRYVVSFAGYAFTCSEANLAHEVKNIPIDPFRV